MIVAVILFYRDKIKVPLGELTDASELIGKNELDFQITYDSRDELGRLCREFERMRASLAANNRNMWKMVEEEKALRSAIAHDIRSPLAVLRGYQEMLLEFIPEGILEQKKILEMLQGGMEQIERMDKFIGTMQKLSRLEARRIECTEFTLSSLTEEVRRIAQILQKEAGRESFVIQTSPDKKDCGRSGSDTGGDRQSFIECFSICQEIGSSGNPGRRERIAKSLYRMTEEDLQKVRIRSQRHIITPTRRMIFSTSAWECISVVCTAKSMGEDF